VTWWDSPGVVVVGNVLAAVLGLATIVRVVGHTLGYSALHPGRHPLEVEYGLDVRFTVLEDSDGRAPDVDDILSVSLALSSIACFLAAYMWYAGAYSYPTWVKLFLGLNWLFIISDPAICLGSYAWDRSHG